MRVYILGAGASLHAGYPLMKNLGHELAAWAASIPDSAMNMAFALAHHALAEWRDSSKLDNFELLMTAGDAGELGIEFWPNIRAGMGILLAEFLNSLPRAPAVAYAALANSAASGDVFATFNYDIAFEKELARAGKWHLRDGYGFEIAAGQPKSAVTLLKLHGSANWQATVLGGRTGAFQSDGPVADPRPTFSPFACQRLGFETFSDPLYVFGGVVNYLILPSCDKRFYWNTSFGEEGRPFWDCLWEQTRSAVNLCNEVVLIGYSLPAADQRARELLLDSIPRDTRITICSGGDSSRIADEFRANGHPAVNPVEEPFERWVTRNDAFATAPPLRRKCETSASGFGPRGRDRD